MYMHTIVSPSRRTSRRIFPYRIVVVQTHAAEKLQTPILPTSRNNRLSKTTTKHQKRLNSSAATRLVVLPFASTYAVYVKDYIRGIILFCLEISRWRETIGARKQNVYKTIGALVFVDYYRNTAARRKKLHA